MLSVRLTGDTQDQLDYLSMRTGESKNSIINKALFEYLKKNSLGEAPLSENIQEHRHTMLMKKRDDKGTFLKKIKNIENWITEQKIWTKNSEHPVTISGEPTPGIYGRNIVTNYYVDEEDNIYIISKYISWPAASGIDQYHAYVTLYDEWVEFMKIVAFK